MKKNLRILDSIISIRSDFIVIIPFKLFSDGWFLVAMDSYLRLRLANKNRAQTYVYLLTHNTTASFSDVFEGDEETFYGACKCLRSNQFNMID